PAHRLLNNALNVRDNRNTQRARKIFLSLLEVQHPRAIPFLVHEIVSPTAPPNREWAVGIACNMLYCCPEAEDKAILMPVLNSLGHVFALGTEPAIARALDFLTIVAWHSRFADAVVV